MYLLPLLPCRYKIKTHHSFFESNAKTICCCRSLIGSNITKLQQYSKKYSNQIIGFKISKDLCGILLNSHGESLKRRLVYEASTPRSRTAEINFSYMSRSVYDRGLSRNNFFLEKQQNWLWKGVYFFNKKFWAHIVLYFPFLLTPTIFLKILISAPFVDARRQEAKINLGRVASRLRGLKALWTSRLFRQAHSNDMDRRNIFWETFISTWLSISYPKSSAV